jgi:hypothetical protein
VDTNDNIFQRLYDSDPNIRALCDGLGMRAADPSHTFPNGNSYRHWEIKRRGLRTRFCFSVNPNQNGQYATWVEVEQRKGEGVRRDWDFSISRRDVRQVALNRYQAAKAKISAPHQGRAV